MIALSVVGMEVSVKSFCENALCGEYMKGIYEMLQIAVVEDDEKYAEQIKEFLRQYEQEAGEGIQISTFSDGDEIIEAYRSQFDIILMDIEMQFMDGMEAARQIRKLDSNVIIIFITNMAQYAIQGYEVDALDYVLKPVSYFAFAQRLGRAISRMKRRETKYITIHAKSSVYKIAVSDIFWIDSQGHRLTYHTAAGTFESTTSSMKEVEENLKEDHFFRGNKCFLINMAHVKGIEEGCAVVQGNKIQISRAKRGEFQKALTNYIGEMMK